MEENQKKAQDKDHVGFLHITSRLRQNSFRDIQEDQLYRLHEDTEFTEEEFVKYKNEKVLPVDSVNSILRSGRLGR